MTDDLKRTPLHDLHLAANARMVPFAGYDMPVSYPLGVLREHQHTRDKAGLFDVSHMGQIHVSGDDAVSCLESVMPVDVAGLAPGRQRYGLFTSDSGGILDDLMIARHDENRFTLVVNAACKEDDFAHLQASIGNRVTLDYDESSALVALQGPAACQVLESRIPEIAGMRFMDVRTIGMSGQVLTISRSGYTGEDGFEISISGEAVAEFCESLLTHEDVEWIGLGARDSLRLEAGLPLYGHEMDQTTTPVEASLQWAISKSRRSGGEREGGFPGAQTILPQLATAPARKLVGIKPEGRAPVRDGAVIMNASGTETGHVTSGGFGPSVGGPVCMGFVSTEASAPGTRLTAIVRDKPQDVSVCKLPFAPHRYFRG